MCCGNIIRINDCTITLIESDGTKFSFDSIVELEENFVVLKNANTNRRIVSSELLSPRGNLKDFFSEFLATCSGCCDSVPTPEYISEDLVIIDNDLPQSFTECTSAVFIDITLTQDVDISLWNPTGLCPGATVRFKKIGKNPFVLTWKGYDFLNGDKELMTFEWNGTEFKIV